MGRKKNSEGKFWSRVDKNTDGCWNWTGLRLTTGYGQYRYGGKSVGAHRLAMLFTHGSIPSGAFVLHSCDNKLCCNPSHLRFGDAKENAADAVARGRQFRGEFAPNAKLTEAHVRIIKRIGRSMPRKALAKGLGVSESSVYAVLDNKTWAHVQIP